MKIEEYIVNSYNNNEKIWRILFNYNLTLEMLLKIIEKNGLHKNKELKRLLDMKEYYLNSRSLNKVGKKFNLTKQGVSWIFKLYGIDIKELKKQSLLSRDIAIINDYNDNQIKIEDIAKKYNISTTTLYNIIGEYSNE